MDVYQRRRCAIAYTKIIPVRHHLQRCLDYTSNPNKTEIFTESDLKRLLSYTQNQDKTEHQLYVSGFQCDPDTACQSMEETKRVWFMPTDKGILAYHIIQSFAPGEATPEQVHQIGCEFARRFLADRFECTVSTHLDKGHLHNHIVTNSVSFIDGRMFRNDFDTYYQGIRKISDELCRENRLSVIETDGKGQGYADWLSGKTGKPTIRSMVRKDVELAIAAADTFDGFIAELQAMGYTVKYGPRVEHMAVRHQSAQRSVRIDRLDARYSESALRDYYRQLRHLPADMCREYKAQHAPEPTQWLSPELAPVGKRMRYRSSLSKPHRKVSGFMACYYRYCALLRKAYHGKATKRCYFLLREDFKRFNRYQQQTHLLWEHRLQTLAEVQAYKSNLENQIEQLARQRKVLYRQKQEPERAAREEQIQKLTKQIKALRHEFYICTDIEADAHRHNLNVVVIGGSGSGKTRFYVKPNAMQASGSYLFLDPKGELVRSLGGFYESLGIPVTVIDLVHFKGHYNPMHYIDSDEDAVKLAYAIVNNTKPKDAPASGDKFWDDASVLLISALILYLIYEAPVYEQNFSTLMYMIQNCQMEEGDMGPNPLEMLFNELQERDPLHPAVLQFNSFKLGSTKTLQSVLITASANLYMFNTAQFAEMTNTDTMFLPRLGLEKRVIFCVIPDNDKTYNFLITMLYTQLFDQLFRLADSEPKFDGALPVHVRFMMDEFANVALPANFKNILAVCRSRNISCDIILQSKSQIQSLYKDDWEGMIGNCDSLIYLGGNEYATFEWLSKYIGKMTERTKSQSIGRGSRGSSSDSYQLSARDLCSPDEIRCMDDGDCLVLLRSEPPVIDHKFDLMRHPNVKLIPDGGAAPYRMPDDYAQTAQSISPDIVTGLTEPAITDVMYDEIQKIMEEIHNEQERNL